MTLLDVVDLHVDLGGRRVLTGVDLRVDAGELVALLGPNGAGKTTLLRSILALVPVTRGSVLVDGRASRRGGSAMGYVPQRHEFAWDFPISVEDAVMSGRTGALGLLRRPGVADWRAVNDALERVRMTELRARTVGELSGGQRQRVLVARALALRPRILLLDEPSTGLDLPTQELLSDLFTDLAAEGTAVLMTTHDILGAIEACTRLALLRQTIVADAAPSELRDAEPWMRAFDVGAGSPLLKLVTAA